MSRMKALLAMSMALSALSTAVNQRPILGDSEPEWKRKKCKSCSGFHKYSSCSSDPKRQACASYKKRK